jgi:hypothetical protein
VDSPDSLDQVARDQHVRVGDSGTADASQRETVEESTYPGVGVDDKGASPNSRKCRGVTIDRVADSKQTEF